MESLAVREEMACKITSWRLAFNAFSSESACSTSEISSFKRVWSCSRVSSEGAPEMEDAPEIGVKGVCSPCSKTAAPPLVTLNLHPSKVLLPISYVAYNPTFFCRGIPKYSNTEVNNSLYPQIMVFGSVCDP